MKQNNHFQEKLITHQSLFSKEEYSFIKETLSRFTEMIEAIVNWEEAGINDDKKKKLISSLFAFDQNYPGGLEQYAATGKEHLQEILQRKNKINQIKKISVPACDSLVDLAAVEEKKYQEIAIANFDKLAISLVAGGIGERLGLNIEKINIPFDSYQRKTYLQWYCEMILAMQWLYQKKYNKVIQIPLMIMVSEKTMEGIQKALTENDYFGLQNEQIWLERQLMAPCFKNFNGEIALENQYQLLAKPHGHGDVHILIYRNVLSKLQQNKKEFLFFIQDTNIQILNLISTGLGFCIAKEKDFSFFAIKKDPNEQVGSLAKVVTTEGQTQICNIEYNQVATLKEENFKKKEFEYPANTNILFTRITPYAQVLQKRKGQLFEFINPKIAEVNNEKQLLKFPRLETMMQDIVKYYSKTAKVGVILVDKDKCFSPLKTNLKNYLQQYQEDKDKIKTNTLMKSTLVFSEKIYFTENQKKLLSNNYFKKARNSKSIGNIQLSTVAKVLLHPIYHLSTDFTQRHICNNHFGEDVVVALDGDVHLENVTIEDGSALIVRAYPGVKCIIKDLTIQNKGYLQKEISDDLLRVYDYQSLQVASLVIKEVGVYQVAPDLSYRRIGN